MQAQLAYLKSVVEGVPDVEPWREWFQKHSDALERMLSRTEFLKLKLDRIKAIPPILARFEVAFVASDRYAYLGGVPDRCRECGATLERYGSSVCCPEGCFALLT